jgi:hypothetical protein
MRNELLARAQYPAAPDPSRDDLLAVLAFCLFGLVATLSFAAATVGIDQLPLLIIQYNLG